MHVETFADVFDALADSPAEAANMKARADLMAALAARVSHGIWRSRRQPPAWVSLARVSTI